jgi:hypothetical protein
MGGMMWWMSRGMKQPQRRDSPSPATESLEDLRTEQARPIGEIDQPPCQPGTRSAS